jgi:hypothetical protein
MNDVTYVNRPMPKMGNKIECIENHGTYVLEQGPGTWRSLAVTRTGNGTISMYLGLPEPNGSTHKLRKVFRASVMGMWMFDAGFDEGLTLVCEGSGIMAGGGPCISVTWVEERKAIRKIETV